MGKTRMPSSSRASDSGVGSDSGTPSPLTEHPRVLSDQCGGSGGNIHGVDAPRVFEVEFPPTGPLGITFEWAADPGALRCGDGSTPAASPRTPRFRSSTLPPISPSPSSTPKGRAAHPLEPPARPGLLLHALRVQSFPELPSMETNTRAGTTITEGGEGKTSTDGEIHPITEISSDVSGFLRREPRASDQPRVCCSQRGDTIALPLLLLNAQVPAAPTPNNRLQASTATLLRRRRRARPQRKHRAVPNASDRWLGVRFFVLETSWLR